MIQFKKYDKVYLEKSWIWLQDDEIRKLTNTPFFSAESQQRWFMSLESKTDYLIWGIELNNSPIGACGLKYITNQTAEYWGYIGEKSYWGKGYGKYLLHYCIQKAIDLHLKTITLKVTRTNQRAIKLYVKNGFIEIKHEDDLIVMSYSL